jgi:hypothetical protein
MCRSTFLAVAAAPWPEASVDGSLVPTSIGANTQLSICAVAARIAGDSGPSGAAVR